MRLGGRPEHRVWAPGPPAGLGSRRTARRSPTRTARSPTPSWPSAPRGCAGALRRLGVGRGDRVAYLGVNAVEVFETLFAAWLLGAIAVPLNYRLSGPEIRYMLDDSGASVLVHSADAAALSRGRPLPDEAHRARRAPGQQPGGALDYEAEIATGPGPRRGAAGRARRPRPDPLHLGHDGPPQGRGAHPRQPDLEHRQLPRPRRRAEHRQGAVHRPAVPLRRARPGHAAHAVQGRQRRASCRRPTPAWSSSGCRQERITSFSAVPTMLQMMCEHPSWDAADLSSLTLVQYGGLARAGAGGPRVARPRRAARCRATA